MATQEKFCLRWNDFETNVSQAFRELREEKDFFDVTLACEDNQVSAHKVILSACSPFFRTVLRRNPHQHPLLYLKGVKYQELLSVLNFMYMGEVNVAQEELNSFLAVAEELRVKGLTQNSSESSKQREPTQRSEIQTSKRMRPAPPPATSRQKYREQEEEVQEVEAVPVKSEPREQPPPPPPYQDEEGGQYPQSGHHQDPSAALVAEDSYQEEAGYEEYVQFGNGYGTGESFGSEVSMRETGGGSSADMIAAREEEIVSNILKDSQRKMFTCAICQFGASSRHKVFCHIESQHFKDSSITYNCPFCDKLLSSRNSLGIHVSRNHKHERGNSLNSIFPKEY